MSKLRVLRFTNLTKDQREYIYYLLDNELITPKLKTYADGWVEFTEVELTKEEYKRLFKNKKQIEDDWDDLWDTLIVLKREYIYNDKFFKTIKPF